MTDDGDDNDDDVLIWHEDKTICNEFDVSIYLYGSIDSF